jgi:hypothetical protein
MCQVRIFAALARTVLVRRWKTPGYAWTSMDRDNPQPNDDPSFSPSDGESHEAGPEAEPGEATPELLARARYGLGKELRLYPDEFAVVNVETAEDLRWHLSSIRRLILSPGEQVPSKLVLMFDLDDGNTVIAAEGMSNVKDFRKLLARLVEIKPDLELDPANMDEQLRQALDIRRRSLLGCYGGILIACYLLWVVYMIVALLPHLLAHTPHH